MILHHFSQLIRRQAEKYGDRVAFRFKDYSKSGIWVSSSWKQFSEKVDAMAKALVSLGVKEHDNIATYAPNCPEGLIADFGTYANNAVVVPLYATSSLYQIEYIINESEIRILFVGEQFQYNNAFAAMSHCATLQQLIVIDRNVKLHADDTSSLFFDDVIEVGEQANTEAIVNERISNSKTTDLSNIIYTSGTTGEPKGVMLTHSNFLEAIRIHQVRLTTISDKDVSLCFLPLTHIFERAWTYFCFSMGIRVDINPKPTEIQTAIKEVSPTIMCSVPRFWEKVYAAVQEKVSSTTGVARKLMNAAIAVGHRRNLDYCRIGKKAPILLEAKYQILDKLVLSKVRKAVGLERGNIFPVAGAPLSDTINSFLHACGVNIVYGYGLSETTATVTCFDQVNYKMGTVGVTMPDVQIKIGTKNEILVKGGTVMLGYYKKAEETAKVFTEDGWFRTGDAGKVDEDGALVLTERLKDLFKTSNGKYIAPQAIETRLGEDKYIDQIAVIGDQRKYVTAIIIPAYEALKEYAAQKQIQYRTIEELVKNQSIQKLIQERINTMQSSFARFEQVKRFTLLPRAFSMETGELTNTLKIRRPIINQLYHAEIEAMYA